MSEARYEEENTMERVEKTFVIPNVLVTARTNMIEPGVEAKLETVQVWVSRDIPGGPSVWHGLAEDTNAKALFLNAARLDSAPGIARLTSDLTRLYLVSLEEASTAVEAAAVAAGLREVEQTLARDRALIAAAKIADRRNDTVQLALAEGRERLRMEVGQEALAKLLGAPTTTEDQRKALEELAALAPPEDATSPTTDEAPEPSSPAG